MSFRIFTLAFLFSSSCGESQWSIPSSNWPAGSYYLTLNDAFEQQVLRWEKK